ncbi:MAG: xanthine dehydrogenase family protein subunit M [Gammaproteobacteria bacterium]|nr:xanthine dehydrogenase family protein subunit M [Gammaproteobacteria bacterium]
MREFNYYRAGSVRDAAKRLGASGNAMLLAGGMTLLPALKMRLNAPGELIDLADIGELKGIRLGRKGAQVGATTTHAEVAENVELRAAIPVLPHAAESIGDPQVRNRGTLGGSLANNDPAADYPAVALGLGATIITNKRKISADDYFTGMFETALGRGEMVTQVLFPIPQRAGYAKFPNPATRYALVGVCVAQFKTGVRVAVTGAGAAVYRLEEFEDALSAEFSAVSLSGLTASAASLNDDMHAGAEYRAHLVGAMARRAVAMALD